MLSIVVGLTGSIWMVVWMGYQYGGINLDWWFYNRFGEIVHGDSAYKIANPRHPLNDFGEIGPRFMFAGIGAAIMGLLMYARHHFLWCGTLPRLSHWRDADESSGRGSAFSLAGS